MVETMLPKIYVGGSVICHHPKYQRPGIRNLELAKKETIVRDIEHQFLAANIEHKLLGCGKVRLNPNIVETVLKTGKWVDLSRAEFDAIQLLRMGVEIR